MEGYLSPIETGCFIAETGKDVKVNAAGVSKVAKLMYETVKSKTYSIKSWKEHELNPKVCRFLTFFFNENTYIAYVFKILLNCI